MGDTQVLARLATSHLATYYRCTQLRAGGTTSRVIGTLIHAHHAPTAERLGSLIRDAEEALRRPHPNLVQILGVHEVGGQTFLVQEAYAGPRLSDLVTRAWRSNALYLGHFCSVAAGVARGLHHAHRRPGFVHGDVVMENILVFPTGVAKLLDVELAGAKQRIGRGCRPRHIEYTAPEALVDSQVDHRADLFALGVGLYRATTGVYPYTGDSPEEVLEARRKARPRSPSSIVPDYPPQLEQIVLWALEREPAARPATAADLADALEAFCRSSRGSSSPRAVQGWLAGLYPPGTDAWNATEPTTTRTPLPHRLAVPVPDRSAKLLVPMLTATGVGLVAVVVLLLLLLSQELRAGGDDPRVESLVDRGMTELMSGQSEKAQGTLRDLEGLETASEPLQARVRALRNEVQVRMRLREAEDFIFAGRPQAAMAILQRLLEEDPPHPEAVRLLRLAQGHAPPTPSSVVPPARVEGAAEAPAVQTEPLLRRDAGVDAASEE